MAHYRGRTSTKASTHADSETCQIRDAPSGGLLVCNTRHLWVFTPFAAFKAQAGRYRGWVNFSYAFISSYQSTMCNLPADAQTVKSRFNSKHPGRPAREEKLSARDPRRKGGKDFLLQTVVHCCCTALHKNKNKNEMKKKRTASPTEMKKNPTWFAFAFWCKWTSKIW